jgi:hypothetical protein
MGAQAEALSEAQHSGGTPSLLLLLLLLVLLLLLLALPAEAKWGTVDHQ